MSAAKCKDFQRVRMRHLNELETIWLLVNIFTHIAGADVPCAAREGDPGQGRICVCNSSYCDTVERPSKLSPGQFHLYLTSNSTPGFTHTIGSFNHPMATEDDDETVFTIDPTIEYQEIRGFGGSFSDSFGVVMDTLPAEAQDKLIESYFGSTGIEYTFCRTVIGSSDFSLRSYNYDDVPNDKYLKNFSLAEEDYKYKIAYIKKAQKISQRGIEVYACTWEAPQWMKTTTNTASDLTGYLSMDYYQTFADYHVKFIQEYKKNGIDIWAVSEGNEPLLALFMGFRFNLTVTMAHQQRVWFNKYLLPSLRAANLSDVKFLALDDMRMYAVYWMKRFADDTEAYNEVDGIALHWYLDFFVPPLFLDLFHLKFPDKKIYYTESSINVLFDASPKPVQLGSWIRGALYMYNIIENINHWTNGYIDWNLALNTEGGPTIGEPIDAAVIVNETGEEFYKQPIFYGIGHFSKFIPPGSRRISVTSKQNVPSENHIRDDIEHVDFLKAEPSVVAPSVVACLATANSDTSYTIVVLNNKNVTARVRLSIGNVSSITLDLEEYSINTLVYWLKD